MATHSPSSKENVPFHGGYVAIHHPAHSSRLASKADHDRARPSDTGFKLSLESEQPAAKKRKLTPSAPTNSQPSQSSFADVLERLKEEAGESKGTFARIRSMVF